MSGSTSVDSSPSGAVSFNVEEMIQTVMKCKPLSEPQVLLLCEKAKEVLQKESNVQPKEKGTIICNEEAGGWHASVRDARAPPSATTRTNAHNLSRAVRCISREARQVRICFTSPSVRIAQLRFLFYDDVIRVSWYDDDDDNDNACVSVYVCAGAGDFAPLVGCKMRWNEGGARFICLFETGSALEYLLSTSPPLLFSLLISDHSTTIEAMLIPVRCYSCGKVVGNLYEPYQQLLDADYTEAEALDMLQLERYCCRRMILSHIDLIEDLMLYNVPVVGTMQSLHHSTESVPLPPRPLSSRRTIRSLVFVEGRYACGFVCGIPLVPLISPRRNMTHYREAVDGCQTVPLRTREEEERKGEKETTNACCWASRLVLFLTLAARKKKMNKKKKKWGIPLCRNGCYFFVFSFLLLRFKEESRYLELSRIHSYLFSLFPFIFPSNYNNKATTNTIRCFH
eukprot:gene13438-9249_t